MMSFMDDVSTSRGYQRTPLNALFEQRTLVPDPSPWFEAWREGSEQARRRTRELRVDISYGNREGERFDLYLPTDRPRNLPFAAFVHGDAWRRAIRADAGFPAKAFHRHDVAFVAIGYDAVPDVDLAGQVDQVCRAWRFFSFRALDELGWEHAPVLLRPPVRFLSRHPELDPAKEYEYFYEPGIKLYKDPDLFAREAEEHGVDLDSLELQPDSDETAAIEQLAEQLGALAEIARVNGLVLDALHNGLSLAGAGHAMSIGAGRLFLRSNTGNPFDVHVHTGINARRYLLGLEGLSVRAKALALLSWSTGPEVYYLDETLNRSLVNGGDSLSDGLNNQKALLDAIEASIFETPVVDLRERREGETCGRRSGAHQAGPALCGSRL